MMISPPTPDEIRQGRFDRAVSYLAQRLKESGLGGDDTIMAHVSLLELAHKGRAVLSVQDAAIVAEAFSTQGWLTEVKKSSPSFNSMIVIKEPEKTKKKKEKKR